MSYPDPQTHAFLVHSLSFPPPEGFALVGFVSLASGGGSYRDRELRDQIGSVSSEVMGVFARPFTEHDRDRARCNFQSSYMAANEGYADWLKERPSWEKAAE